MSPSIEPEGDRVVTVERGMTEIDHATSPTSVAWGLIIFAAD